MESRRRQKLDIDIITRRSSQMSSPSAHDQWQAAVLCRKHCLVEGRQETPNRPGRATRLGRSLQLGRSGDGLRCRWPKCETCVLHPERLDPPRTHTGLKTPSCDRTAVSIAFHALYSDKQMEETEVFITKIRPHTWLSTTDSGARMACSDGHASLLSQAWRISPSGHFHRSRRRRCPRGEMQYHIVQVTVSRYGVLILEIRVQGAEISLPLGAIRCPGVMFVWTS